MFDLKSIGMLVACLGVSTPVGFTWAQESGEFHELRASLVGFPTESKVEAARRIGDLILFDGKLYVGHGNQMVNTGPTDVISYDLSTGKFTREFVVDEEEITRYRVLDGRLVVPGTDATEDWSFGNVYLLTEAGWKKHRTVPNGLHVFDMVSYRDRWYAAIHSIFEFPYGAERKPIGGMVLSSNDQGAAWQFEYSMFTEINTSTYLRRLIVYRDKLYAFPEAGGKGRRIVDPLGADDAVVYDGDLWRPVDLIPDRGVHRIHPFRAGEKLGLWVTMNEGGESTKALSETESKLYGSSGDKARRVPMPPQRLQDILEKDGKAFLLVERAGRWMIAGTPDLVEWIHHRLPESVAEPLSIEFDGHSFYVGTKSGRIYRTSVVE